MPELTFEQKVALFKATADSPQARMEYAHSRAAVINPMLAVQSTVRAIFSPVKLAPGAEAKWDVPFEDIDVVYSMPNIGGIPTAQFEGSELRIDTFGLDGGVEYQMDLARDGRIDVARLSTVVLKNSFIRQEELCGWGLIKNHAAVLPPAQIVAALDDSGGTSGTKRLNIHTINVLLTCADELGVGGRRVAHVYCTPRRFGDLRNTITMQALPEALRTQVWGNGQPSENTVADITIHRVYNKNLVADNRAYAFTEKEGYTYGILAVREELRTMDNPIAILEWKLGTIGRERLGFGVLDSLGLVEIQF